MKLTKQDVAELFDEFLVNRLEPKLYKKWEYVKDKLMKPSWQETHFSTDLANFSIVGLDWVITDMAGHNDEALRVCLSYWVEIREYLATYNNGKNAKDIYRPFHKRK